MNSVLQIVDRAFLNHARIGHLATADRHGQPHVVPVCYALIGSTVYIAIDRKPKIHDNARQLRRVRNIVENPDVCLTVDHYEENWSRLGWIMLRGHAELINSGVEHETALGALIERYPQYHSQMLHDRLVIALRISSVSRWGALT